MGSIRTFLIAGTLATLCLFNFVAALHGYQSSMREAEVLFDNQLLDFARLVSRLDVGRLDEDFRLGNNLAFQVWSEGSLQAASGHAPAAPITAFASGFDYANFDGYRWRTYTRLEPRLRQWVMVAERTDLRYVLAENVVLESVFPILAGIPLVGLLIWGVVSHGLRPLRELSMELKDKRAGDLSPIHYRNTRRELDQVTQSLNAFMSRLGRALEREKRFSADAAHELRTPISALKVQLHNLKEEMAAGSEALPQLEAGVERLRHLVEQLLSLYRVSPEQFTANRRELDLYQLVQDVTVQQYPLIERKGQSLELLGESCFIQGEAFALETLVGNLLGNAVKYTQEGGRIVVRLEKRPTEVCLVVEDNGPGIPEEERERVFDRFYRGGSATGEGGRPGCGLGLAIVRHVAELHQARVSLASASPGPGCAFSVCFDRPEDAA